MTPSDSGSNKLKQGGLTLAVGIAITTVLVFLMAPIDAVFESLGAASNRSEVVVPFVAVAFLIAAASLVFQHLTVKREARLERGDKGTSLLLGKIVVMIGIVILCLQMLIFVAIFFFAG